MTRLDDALRRLVERDVLTPEQARAVRDEVGADPGTAGGARGAARRRTTVSPAAELGAYLGGALTLVAVLFLVGERLEDAEPLVVAFVLGVMAAVFLGAGFAIRDNDERDAVRWRLTGTLWAMGVLGAAFATAALVHEGRSASTVVTSCGLVALVLAVVLYGLQRSVAQLVVLVLSLMTTVTGLAVSAGWEAVGVAASLVAAGGAVMLAGLAGLLEPDETAVTLGAAFVLVGLQVVASEGDWRRLALLAMVAAAVGMFVLASRTGVVLSGVATLGLTAALPQAIDEFGGGRAPLPIVLLVAGLALLAGAVLTARTRR